MIEGPLIFLLGLITATAGILAALYAVVRDTEPDRGADRRVRFWNFR